MKVFAEKVVKHKKLIAILGLVLLIPCIFGYLNTRINYDMLTYLPDDIQTVQGQKILLDDFNKGSFALLIFEDMDDKDVSAAREKIEDLEYVDSALWYDSIADITVPKEILPDDIYDEFNNGDCTLMAVFLSTTISSDEAMDTIRDIRQIAGKQCFVSSMSAYITDLKDLAEAEEPIYVALAVLLACIVFAVFMDSFLLPVIFLASIGIAIVVNLGTNIFMGEISYVTKAISAVLQLGVTMDYSIFLWHSYCEHKDKTPDHNAAMAEAIRATIASVSASSVTTIAGFIALCFMSFTLGADLGIVMAKGVVLGVIASVTVLPSFILICDKAIDKTTHKPVNLRTDRIAGFVLKHRRAMAVMFIIVMIPALYGYLNADQYYDLDQSIPQDMDCVVANTKLNDTFGMDSTHMLLCDSDMDIKDSKEMLDRIEDVDGVKLVIGRDTLLGRLIPKDIIPDDVSSLLSEGGRQLVIITSEYRVATDEVNAQINEINKIVDDYDKDAMLIGEAPCTKDMIKITSHDFKVVSFISILAVLVIIAIALGSAALPFILVAVIEFAVFINLGIPFYTGNLLAFIAPICVSTIQLGATVDYAILMTNRYKVERIGGCGRERAVEIALKTSMPSIMISALGFFAATIGVGIYSDVDIIGSMCGLMARGAIISMAAVILILPSFLMIFDKVICRTTKGMRGLVKKGGNINA